MIARAAKPVSAAAAMAFRRSVSAAKALSGFVALIHRPNVPVLIPDEALALIPDRPPPGPATPPAPRKKESEWEAIASLAKDEIAEILPGWSIDIDIFDSPHIRCHEFVLRAETPAEWGWRRLDGNYVVVEGHPKQVWGARLPVEYLTMQYARDRSGLLQHILGKLCEFARDIRRNAPAPPEVTPPEPCCRVP